MKIINFGTLFDKHFAKLSLVYHLYMTQTTPTKRSNASPTVHYSKIDSIIHGERLDDLKGKHFTYMSFLRKRKEGKNRGIQLREIL